MHLSQVSLSFSNPYLILPSSESVSQLPEMHKINNSDFHLIQPISMLSRSMTTKHLILIIAFSLKELLKEFGNFVPPSMKEGSLFLKLLNGTKNSNKQTRALVKMGRECSDLPNITFQKINSQKDSNSLWKAP